MSLAIKPKFQSLSVLNCMPKSNPKPQELEKSPIILLIIFKLTP